MSTTKHTPGPWQTFRQGTKHFVSQAADEDFRFAHAVVFEANYHPDSIAAARNEAEANARLIAAAPNLIAALHGVDGLCQQGLNSADPVHWEAALQDIMGLVRAAIATGGDL